eukprot:566088-Heterocapsa_arctica.AAC.1
MRLLPGCAHLGAVDGSASWDCIQDHAQTPLATMKVQHPGVLTRVSSTVDDMKDSLLFLANVVHNSVPTSTQDGKAIRAADDLPGSVNLPDPVNAGSVALGRSAGPVDLP